MLPSLLCAAVPMNCRWHLIRQGRNISSFPDWISYLGLSSIRKVKKLGQGGEGTVFRIEHEAGVKTIKEFDIYDSSIEEFEDYIQQTKVAESLLASSPLKVAKIHKIETVEGPDLRLLEVETFYGRTVSELLSDKRISLVDRSAVEKKYMQMVVETLKNLSREGKLKKIFNLAAENQSGLPEEIALESLLKSQQYYNSIAILSTDGNVVNIDAHNILREEPSANFVLIDIR